MNSVLKKNLIIFFILLIIGAIFGIIYVLPTEFDFLNYRYYNGWAFFNNRLCADIMPAAFRTYFNPILDAANFFLIDKLNNHPYIYLATSGLKMSLFMYMSYLTFDMLLIKKGFSKIFIIFSAMVLTAFSPIILFTSGYGYTDIQPAIPIMISICIYLKILFKEKSRINLFFLFLSGAIAGMAVGIKYTQGIFALAMLLSTLLLYKKIKSPVKSIIMLFCGMSAGFLLTGGYWMYLLWKHFGNPLFPYFNSVFHSPLADTESIFAEDFSHLHAKNFIDFIFYPLKNSSYSNTGNEWGYVDLKIPLSFISIIIYFVLYKFCDIKSKLKDFINVEFFNIIVFITVLTYYLNLMLFAQLRYVIPLFAFSSIIILTVLYSIYTVTNLKNNEPNFYNFGLVAIAMVIFNQNLFNLGTLLDSALLIVAFFIFLISFIIIGKMISREEMNIYMSICLVVLCFFACARFISSPTEFLYHDKIVNIKNMNIKNNSNVICGTMLTSFVIPKQNSKAKYIGFAIPNNFDNNGYYYKYTDFKNMYFKNKYLEKKLKKIFKEDKDLYFIYSTEGAHGNEDIEIYNNSVRYYSNNTIEYLKNCKNIPYDFLNDKFYGDLKICKLK